MLGIVEQVLIIVSALVALAGLIGMLTTVMASLNERRREWPSCVRWAHGRVMCLPC